MTVQMKSPIPVLRIFDEAKARELYVGFLGFKVDWEHRFGENFPLYMQVSRDACVIHLSEHHGDGCPGATLRIEMTGLDEFVAALRARDYRYLKPGCPEETPWGTREVSVPDPFGNKLIFYERVR
jgi:catechol 2,3-dioxygenase-like lactoylglutathione lyase family enzyme